MGNQGDPACDCCVAAPGCEPRYCSTEFLPHTICNRRGAEKKAGLPINECKSASRVFGTSGASFCVSAFRSNYRQTLSNSSVLGSGGGPVASPDLPQK